MEWKMESQQLLEPTFLAPGVLDDKLSANSIKHIQQHEERGPAYSLQSVDGWFDRQWNACHSLNKA